MKIQIKNDVRVFLLYVFLNAGGYKPEHKIIHPFRKYILNFLNKNLTILEQQKIKNLTIKPAEIKKEFWYPYRSWVLSHGNPPNFPELSTSWKRSLDKKTANKLKEQLSWLWTKKNISQLWTQIMDQYQKILPKIERKTLLMMKLCEKYLKISRRVFPFETFIVIPNFLEEYNRGLGPTVEKNAYAILGPSNNNNDQFPKTRIQHELLHGIINPLTKNIFSNLSAEKLSIVRETLINGIVLRTHLNNTFYVDKKLRELKKRGMYVSTFLNLLKNKYEGNEYSFVKFLIFYAKEIEEACLPK